MSYEYDAKLLAALKAMKARPRLIRNAIRCRRCDTVIESKHQHDFKSCPCGAVFVDGGHSYQRIGGEPADWEDLSEWRKP